ncbi:hypothetical protein ERO13_A01G068350v2 [Gossypium hirsutum]|uniref:Uncharacterized protein n=1 Tax=Gossypium darwinii TaxID=34276 RepID=A0A5D2HIU4_GOSDA|nr:hypothetical protein ERO13_A01G068350v2 [Gossypium hirsutum]TYH30205.1 hypothetical protein ES288_A01G075700v1 [Gossypium darwinii]
MSDFIMPTHLFNFLCGECTITLEDMTLQFDFPTEGRVVIENHIVGNDVYEICEMYLGNVLESKYTKGLYLKMTCTIAN